MLTVTVAETKINVKITFDQKVKVSRSLVKTFLSFLGACKLYLTSFIIVIIFSVPKWSLDLRY